jgi:putative ABC transport system permease protein
MQKIFSSFAGAAGRFWGWLFQQFLPRLKQIRLPSIRSLPTWRLARRWIRDLLPGLSSRFVDLLAIFNSMLVMVIKRLRHNLGLSISAVLGIIAVLGMIVCVPVFSHAVSSEVLRSQLSEKAVTLHRGLFSLHLYYQDRHSGPAIKLEQSQFITQYLHDNAPRLIGPQIERVDAEVQTNTLNWSPVNFAPKVASSGDTWLSMGFVSMDYLQKRADIVEGQWPKASTEGSGPIQVAVLQSAADESFISVGDRYKSKQFEVEVVGIWKPKNELSLDWFGSPSSDYKSLFWVPLDTFRARIDPVIDRSVFFSSWYVIFKENSLRFDQAGNYARGMIRLDAELRRLLPGMTTDYTPLEALNTYQSRADSLTTLSYAVGGPMLILALLFIALTASIAVQQYEQETATMRGRGTSWSQVVTLNLAESLALIVAALPFALLVGWLEAILMGKTLSFLKFTNREGLQFSLQGLNLLWLVIGAGFIIIARFFPVLGLSRTTIVRIKQEQSRGTRKPLWERFYLDFILLIPGIYAYVTMKGIAKPAKFLAALQLKGQDQYHDPLLYVAPALFVMALCMIAIRILPLLMRLLAFLFDRLPGVWAYLSLQQISRRPQDHSSALLLIMISLSLSIYSASTAKTLDKWQHDSLYYQSGADLAIHEYYVQRSDQALNLNSNAASSSNVTISDMDLNVESYLNLEEHKKLPNIEEITRVGKYEGTFSYGVGEQNAIFMGIDRIEFPKVAFYRDDFAAQPLGVLMNALGAEPMGVLVPQSLAQKVGFRSGDHLMLSINILGQNIERDMIMVGTYNQFPTVYPGKDPTLIVNLDSIFDNPDSAVGYDLWLKLRKNTDVHLLQYQIRQLLGAEHTLVKVNGNAFDDLRLSMDRPERMGLFGIINVGFIATGLMPGIGFVLYSYASLRRRFIQLGILQAIGLSVAQLIGYLVLEQFLLMGLAILLGAAIGLLSSYLFVPFLQVSATGAGAIPPFEVLIGWAESGWLSLAFAFILFLTVLGTIAYLAQIKVFQAVKMGETL